MSDDRIIELDGDGQPIRCRVHEFFPLDGQEYVLLENLTNQDVVLMRHVTRGGQAVFQVIESDDEFERVIAYVQAVFGPD